MAQPITSVQNAKVLDIDFVGKFEQGVSQLLNVLGIYSPQVLQAGYQIQQYQIMGTLEDGKVVEGQEIPLTNYNISKAQPHVVELKQYRKQTTKQAILKSGYESSVGKTDAQMIRDIQGVIRKELFDFLAGGTGTATGVGLQDAVANAWGVLSTEMSKLDREGEPVYFFNPMDVAAYLGAASINNVESAFGFSYVENFFGLGTCIIDARVPAGTFFATPKENINCYVADLGALAQAGFDYTYDETGLIGVHHQPVYSNGTAETIADTGLVLFPEVTNLIVKGEIKKPAAAKK